MSDNSGRRVVLITGGTKGMASPPLCVSPRRAPSHHHVRLGERRGRGDPFPIESFTRPVLIQANVVDKQDTEALLLKIQEQFGGVDVFISNVSFASLIKSPADYSEKMLLKSIEYSTWPMIGYIQEMERLLDAIRST